MHIRLEALPHAEDDIMRVSELGERQPQPTPPGHEASPDPLDDVFGADDEGNGLVMNGGAPSAAQQQLQSHPSDMRRLQAEHSTAGYRDGVTAAKAASVQAGFDEGFGLGAALGLRAGELLGVLEGLAAATTTAPSATGASSGSCGDAARRLGELLDAARDELSPRSIFGSTYWAPDGTWIYPVVAADEGGGDREDHVLFRDVVEAHPLVSRWSAVAQKEMERCGVDKSALFRDEDDTAGDETAQAQLPTAKTTSTTAQPKMIDALQW